MNNKLKITDNIESWLEYMIEHHKDIKLDRSLNIETKKITNKMVFEFDDDEYQRYFTKKNREQKINDILNGSK